MPTLKNFSAAVEEEDDDQLFPIPEAERSNPEAEVEEEDPRDMDEKKDEAEVEHDVKHNDEEEAKTEDKEASEQVAKARSQSSGAEEQLDSELSEGELELLRTSVQCPICLGIIKRTRTFMTCLHRFCRDCINKSMRVVKNECPACRRQFPSRRSLRADHEFDALIAASFGNIERFEAEELATDEADEAHKKQTQLSIAEVSQRQSGAAVKRRYGKKYARAFPRSQHVGSSSRRRSGRNMGQDTAEARDADDDRKDRDKDPSSDEPCEELLLRKRRKRTPNRLTAQPSSASPNNNDNCVNDGTEEAPRTDSRVISPGPVRKLEVFAWGGGRIRSNSRQNQRASTKSVRNARLNKLMEYLASTESNSIEWDIHLNLVQFGTQCIPNLPPSHLCCRPTLLVRQLREYVALQMQLKVEEVDLLVFREENKTNEDNTSSSTEKMQSLKDDDETLAKLKLVCFSSDGYLLVMYQKRQIG